MRTEVKGDYEDAIKEFQKDRVVRKNVMERLGAKNGWGWGNTLSRGGEGRQEGRRLFFRARLEKKGVIKTIEKRERTKR